MIRNRFYADSISRRPGMDELAGPFVPTCWAETQPPEGIFVIKGRARLVVSNETNSSPKVSDRGERVLASVRDLAQRFYSPVKRTDRAEMVFWPYFGFAP